MSYKYSISGGYKPPIIVLFRRLVFILSLSYMTFQGLWLEGMISWSPAISLFSWQSIDLLSALYKAPISSFIIPYPAVSLSMLSDFFFLAVMYVPIACFIVSYIGEKSFATLWFSMSYIAAITQMISTRVLPASLSFSLTPYSPFSNISFGMIIFWLLMLRTTKTTPNAFFFIPISVEWIGLLSLFICVIAPITNGAYSHALSSLVTGVFAYMYAVTQWQLKSRVTFLETVEQKIVRGGLDFEQWWEWKFMRHLRSFNKWLQSFLFKK